MGIIGGDGPVLDRKAKTSAGTAVMTYRGITPVIVAAAVLLVAPLTVAAGEINGLARVSSGNVIRIGDEPVRLFGLVAPEPAAECSDSDSIIQCGVVAWAELIKLADGKDLSCDTEPGGRGNTVLATCYFGDFDINEAMVRSGWAEASGQPARYKVEQEEARRARRGMWAGRVRSPDRRQAL